MNYDILTAFEKYRDLVLGVGTDLSFWESFLKHSIDEYKNKPIVPGQVFAAIFSAYNINLNTNQGLLRIHEKTLSIKTIDLEKHSFDFFTWLRNLSVVKIYNALELFILESIRSIYFPNQTNHLQDKKIITQINKEIISYLKITNTNFDTTNNRHIILFLKKRSEEINSFLKLPVGTDRKTTWDNFFEFVSILRNIVAHQGAFVSSDALNEIKSKANDIFQQHFTLNRVDGDSMYLSPVPDQFLSFILLCNDFVVNTVKFMSSENDLTIFEMR